MIKDTESRQVRRARERELKKGSKPATHKVYYIELERKSLAGVVYKYYKKVVDVIGLGK